MLSQDASKLKDNLDILLEAMSQHPSKKTGFLTRVILMLEDGPEFAQFSIRHPNIHDAKLIALEKEVSKGQQQQKQ